MTEKKDMALAGLSRPELRRMLAEELKKTTDTIDADLVRQLLGELERRGPDPVFTDDAAVEKACEKFFAEPKKAAGGCRHRNGMILVASLLLVLGILFFALPAAAEAGKVDNVLGWWTDNIFQFFSPGNAPRTVTQDYETDHPGLLAIHDAVTALGVTDPVVPRWVPEGFELVDIKTMEMFDYSTIYARLKKDDKSILLVVAIYNDQPTFQLEKDQENIAVWDVAGQEHYVISNAGEWIVTWMTNGVECTITADCPEEDVLRMIKSIYTSED